MPTMSQHHVSPAERVNGGARTSHVLTSPNNAPTSITKRAPLGMMSPNNVPTSVTNPKRAATKTAGAANVTPLARPSSKPGSQRSASPVITWRASPAAQLARPTEASPKQTLSPDSSVRLALGYLGLGTAASPSRSAKASEPRVAPNSALKRTRVMINHTLRYRCPATAVHPLLRPRLSLPATTGRHISSP